MSYNKANHLVSSETPQYLHLDNKQPNELFNKIEGIIRTLNSELADFANNYQYHPACKEFMTEVRNILLSPKAKRVRGVIPVLIGEALKLDIEDCLLHGLAIELLHFTSLIHDDVIDDHNYRRGHPSLNNTFAKNHAVLIGDYMMCEVINYGLKSKYSAKVINLMVKAVQNLVAGLIMEQNVLPLEQSFDNYSEMVSLKTGSLFCLSFGLPFIADDRFSIATSCGQLFGILFQIYDDYLDLNKDRGYENIFKLLPKTEISKIWHENYSSLIKHSRNIGIEAAVLGMVQYLQTNGYFLDIWLD